MTTLISFIGKPKQRDSRSAAPTAGSSVNSTYDKVTYQFENGFQATTQFFGHAALQHHLGKRASGRASRPEQTRWIVIGTATSGWDMLADVAFDCDESCMDLATEWAATVKGEIDQGAATAPTLKAFENLFPNVDGVEILLRIADDDADALFTCLHECLHDGDSVVLDVTHGFRSMPIHALIALGALRWMKGVTISDILYGAFDRPKLQNDSIPAVSLLRSSKLARATPSLAAVHLSSDLEAAAEVTRILSIGDDEMREGLKSAHVYRSIMQGGRADNLLRSKAVSDAGHWAAQYPIDSLVSGFLRKNSAPAPNELSAAMQFRRAHNCFVRHDYMRAILLLAESIKDFAVEQLKLTPNENETSIKLADALQALADSPIAPSLDRKTLNKLRQLRNMIAHADNPHPDVKKLITDPKALRTFLAATIKTTRQALFPGLSLE
ncbi:MAG: TIGR02221 family CRISPR-associated protein [Planctomycetota bacterium]|nr:TIGR02221 family CRISPR-associated protein [Planctomycetota bacterium]